MTTLRQAILLTADHTEQHPSLFSFMITEVPDCETPGCLVGRIGYFLGIAPGTRCWVDHKHFKWSWKGRLFESRGCTSILGVDSDTFNQRMNTILDSYGWVENAKSAAATLRKYADLYHPEEVEA